MKCYEYSSEFSYLTLFFLSSPLLSSPLLSSPLLSSPLLSSPLLSSPPSPPSPPSPLLPALLPSPSSPQMISAERIMGYSNLESEAPLETLPPHEKPPPAWPERGEIVLDDVSFRYSVDLPLVLKSLSFHIKPSEKVQCMLIVLQLPP